MEYCKKYMTLSETERASLNSDIMSHLEALNVLEYTTIAKYMTTMKGRGLLMMKIVNLYFEGTSIEEAIKQIDNLTD